VKLDACQGSFFRPELLWFQAYAKYNARLAIRMEGKCENNLNVEFWCEVGMDWITDKIIIENPDLGSSLVEKEVEKGVKLGELAIGSLAEIYFPDLPSIHYQVLVQRGEKIRGGQTPLVKWKAK
jgi:hypothetical protein